MQKSARSSRSPRASRRRRSASREFGRMLSRDRSSLQAEFAGCAARDGCLGAPRDGIDDDLGSSEAPSRRAIGESPPRRRSGIARRAAEPPGRQTAQDRPPTLAARSAAPHGGAHSARGPADSAPTGDPWRRRRPRSRAGGAAPDRRACRRGSPRRCL